MWIFLGLLLLALNIWAIVDILGLRRQADVENKILWVLIIIFLPFLGLVLYIIFGDRR